MAEPRDWVVHDVGSPSTLKMVGPDEPSWGPMTETEARMMVARNPSGYWAKRLTPPTSLTFTLDDLQDPATIVDVLKTLGWRRVVDTHRPECPAVLDDGNRCNCVPDAPTWSAPKAVYDFLGEDWDSRLASAKERNKEK